MDKLRCMEAFVAAVDRGSFSAAAEALGVSSVMVGKQVRQLEDHLGTRLLQRNTRRQSLTESGTHFYDSCRKVLEQLQWAEASVEGLRQEPRGSIRISASVTYGSCIVAPLICGYLDRYPEVRVELILSNSRVGLIEDNFDLALRMGRIDSPDLVARPVQPYRMSICASPAYLARYGVPQTPADLARHSCLAHTAWRGGHGWRLKDHAEDDWAADARFTSNDGHALRAAAVAGAGLVMQPEVLLAEDVHAGRLIPVLESFLPAPRPLHVVYLADRRPRPKLMSLVNYLLEQLA
ncbi:DNA-binding transcriptional LysR family regulator [Luteibacter sp. Sphag1AF]|uniref:LysR family transcriptional regulator n=1 Tax=Luteibacter sp. Sphag1AF TaxID=2587031 RepID=UPI00161AFB7B|nr:LysR family transcriptional regulator [Luteibacter sp. Sphag1AF]MBB3228358.1 DNA-binding transcriptional LysR family regulator [Luteibacter sp. Sphag1AF]